MPGPETSGAVERIGNQVTSFKDGDRAIVYTRLFDGTLQYGIKSI